MFGRSAPADEPAAAASTNTSRNSRMGLECPLGPSNRFIRLAWKQYIAGVNLTRPFHPANQMQVVGDPRPLRHKRSSATNGAPAFVVRSRIKNKGWAIRAGALFR